MRNSQGIEVKKGMYVFGVYPNGIKFQGMVLRSFGNGVYEYRDEATGDQWSFDAENVTRSRPAETRSENPLACSADDVIETLGPMTVSKGGVVRQNPIGNVENLTRRYHALLVTLADLRNDPPANHTKAEVKRLIGSYQQKAADLRAALQQYKAEGYSGWEANPLTRVKVMSPPQRPAGTRAKPSPDLVKRRRKTAKAPEGFYANPALARYVGVEMREREGLEYGLDSVTPVPWTFTTKKGGTKSAAYSYALPADVIASKAFQEWARANKGRVIMSLRALKATVRELQK